MLHIYTLFKLLLETFDYEPWARTFLAKKNKFMILFIYDGILDWKSFKTRGNFTPLPFDAKADDWNLAPFFVSIASKSTRDWETKR